jgi:hypothetical protein
MPVEEDEVHLLQTVGAGIDSEESLHAGIRSAFLAGIELSNPYDGWRGLGGLATPRRYVVPALG